MLRPNLVSFIESEMALPTLSNKLIEKQNLNFLPLRKFENFLEFFKILQEQTKWISSRNFDEAKSVTDSINGHSSLGVSEKFPKIRFFVKITKSYRFSLKCSIVTPINLSPTCRQIQYSARKLQKFNFSGTRNRFWNANENYSTSKIEIYLQTETQSVLIRLLMSHHMSH